MHLVSEYISNPPHPITIDLVGCGGTGSQVLSGLARINAALIALGKPGLLVTTYDPDIVELPNIGRQLFSIADLGISKAVVLTERMNRYFGFSWRAVNELYEAQNTSNIIITCIDNSKGRNTIGQLLRKAVTNEPYNKVHYWLDLGNGQTFGQVVLGTIGNKKFRLKCVDEVFDLKKVKDKNSGPSCSLAEALEKQDLFINSTIAQFGCNIIWKLLREGVIEHHGCYVNLKTMCVNPILI
jgi:PRTRC genetic system ThiF family protein